MAVDAGFADELGDVEEVGELPRSVVPKRLVEFLNAAEAFGALELTEDDAEDELELAALEAPDEDAELESPRPWSERLPVRAGVTSETKLAAAVTPDNRSVRSTGPRVTVAVRIAA